MKEPGGLLVSGLLDLRMAGCIFGGDLREDEQDGENRVGVGCRRKVDDGAFPARSVMPLSSWPGAGGPAGLNELKSNTALVGSCSAAVALAS